MGENCEGFGVGREVHLPKEYLEREKQENKKDTDV